MAKKMTPGKIAFMVGFFGALLIGLLNGIEVGLLGLSEAVITMILVIAGIVIGLMNVSAKEAVAVMVYALVIGGGAGLLATLPIIGGIVEAMLIALSAVFVPAGIVVGVKTLMEKGQ